MTGGGKCFTSGGDLLEIDKNLKSVISQTDENTQNTNNMNIVSHNMQLLD